MTLRQLMRVCSDGFICFEVYDGSGRWIDDMVPYQASVESIDALDRAVRGWYIMNDRIVVVVDWVYNDVSA